MPQIWPMNWVLLFLVFTLSFLSFLVVTYFFKIGSPLVQSEGGPAAIRRGYNWKW